jgi:signal transduction histidine kinase
MQGIRMNYARQCKIMFPGILAVGYAFGFLQFQVIRNALVDPYGSVIDFRILLLLSVINIAFLTLFSKRALNLLFLTIQLILLLFMITLINGDVTLTVILSSAFLFSAGNYLKKPANLIFFICAGAAILLFQRPIRVGNIQTPPMDTRALMMLGFLFGIILLLDYVMSSIVESYEAMDELLKNQKDTILNLVETNVGIQRYALTKKEEFEDAELLRITRDIHDTVVYVLTNNMTLLRACSYYVPKRLKKPMSSWKTR